MANKGILLGLWAAVVLSVAVPAFAAPAKPLIVLFTPGVSADLRDPKSQEDADAIRAQKAALAVRDRLEDTGIVDAVIYSPDSSLFLRAMLEAHVKPLNPAIPSAEESFAIAKAAGAAYFGMVASYPDKDQKPGASDIELHTQEVESRKTWKSRSSADGSGVSVPLGKGGTRYNNGLLSAANTLVNEFLAGPLHSLSASAPPSLAPPEPIPVVKETPGTTPPDNDAPSLAIPTPVTVPMKAGTTAVATPTASENATYASSGADTDGAAEAERHQGEEQLRTGDTSGAILSFRRAISLSPRNPVYRTALVSAYLTANQNSEALSEVKRMLTVLPADDRKGRLAAMHLMGDILTKNGDTTAARTTYEGIIQAQPDATWAKLALADILQTQGQTDDAETLYKSVLKLTPDDKDALIAYARLLATKGNYNDALKQLTAASTGSDPASRYSTALNLFDDGVNKIADLIEQNRTAWESKRISQDVFYKATGAQSAKISGLVSLLKAVPPPTNSDERVKQRHNKRILAASLLLQGAASLLSQVETGDADAGSQATVFLTEFRREMKEVAETGSATATAAP